MNNFKMILFGEIGCILCGLCSAKICLGFSDNVLLAIVSAILVGGFLIRWYHTDHENEF